MLTIEWVPRDDFILTAFSAFCVSWNDAQFLMSNSQGSSTGHPAPSSSSDSGRSSYPVSSQHHHRETGAPASDHSKASAPHPQTTSHRKYKELVQANQPQTGVPSITSPPTETDFSYTPPDEPCVQFKTAKSDARVMRKMVPVTAEIAITPEKITGSSIAPSSSEPGGKTTVTTFPSAIRADSERLLKSGVELEAKAKLPQVSPSSSLGHKKTSVKSSTHVQSERRVKVHFDTNICDDQITSQSETTTSSKYAKDFDVGDGGESKIYEQVTKTILRKSDNAGKSHAVKKEPIDSEEVQLQVMQASQVPEKTKKDTEIVSCVSTVLKISNTGISGHTSDVVPTSLDQKYLSKQSKVSFDLKHKLPDDADKTPYKPLVPSSDESKEEIQSGELDEQFSVKKKIAHEEGHQVKVSTVSERSQCTPPSVENSSFDRSVSPQHPLEERLTDTVIRRHVKVKSSALKKNSDPTSGSVITPEGYDKHVSSPILPSVTDAKALKSTPIEVQILDKPKLESPIISVQISDEVRQVRYAENVPERVSLASSATALSKSQDSKCGSKDTNQPEVKSKSAFRLSKKHDSKTKPSKAEKEAAKIARKEKAKLDRKQQKRASLSGGSDNKEISSPMHSGLVPKASSPGTKHVSIRDPPDTFRTIELVVKNSPKASKTKAAKSSVKDRDSAGTSQQFGSGDKGSDSGSFSEDGKKNNGTHNSKHSKSCCFCWCCCCSCSWNWSAICFHVTESLSIKNIRRPDLKRQQQLSASLENYFRGEEPQPTLEEIRTWGESFDKLMKCSAGRKLFREFLQCEYSEENILFWLACEELKKETQKAAIEEKARIIYEDFISILSPREVSLDSRVRDVINKNMVAPTRDTFEEAQLQIYTLMHRDSYPRFVNSAIFRKLAQLPAPSRKGSMA